MMESHSTQLHSSGGVPTPPKGILKNTSSSSQPHVSHSPHDHHEPQHSPTTSQSPVETKELTLQNTLQNAGRTSRASPGSRRQSGASTGLNNGAGEGDVMDDAGPRLKWDEANLYLTEQERTAKMKIDEPKTPYVANYNPDDELDEEDEDIGIHAGNLAVDELDMNKGMKSDHGHHTHHHHHHHREDEIPDLELGEAEAAGLQKPWAGQSGRIAMGHSPGSTGSASPGKGEKHVVVGGEDVEEGDSGLMTAEEARKKHQAFEERRKRHYEMSNVKSLLGHPEKLDDLDDDDDTDEGGQPRQPPPVPKIPEQFAPSKQ